MENRDEVIKHLEIIQSVISRLAKNAFMFNGWSMTLVVATIVLMVKSDLKNPLIILTVLVPIFGFWFLGGYFVRQERLFRRLYEETSSLSETNFSMDTGRFRQESYCRRRSAIVSTPLMVFYSIEVAFVVLVFLIAR